MMFSFKSKSKIKKEILNELKAEMEKERVKEEMKKVNESFSSLPTQLPKHVNNSPEDLKEIQMKFLKLSVGLLLLTVIFVLLFIYSDNLFGVKKKDTNTMSNNENTTEINESVNNNTTEEKNLNELENGKIDLSNSKLDSLYSMFGNYTYDYFLLDNSFLYNKDKVLSSDLTNNQLLFLVSRTEEFKKILEDTKLTTQSEVCSKNGVINIDRNKLDQILLNRFNRANIKIESFNSSYYVNNEFITYIKFNLDDAVYKSACFNDIIVSPKVITESLVSSAEKKDNTIILNIKTVFINENGIYKDYNLKNKISDLIQNTGDN